MISCRNAFLTFWIWWWETAVPLAVTSAYAAVRIGYDARPKIAKKVAGRPACHSDGKTRSFSSAAEQNTRKRFKTFPKGSA